MKQFLGCIGLLGILSITGCGFELRKPLQQVQATQSLQLILPSDMSQTDSLSIHEQLHLMGYIPLDAQEPMVIKIQKASIRRYELFGILTEIRLILTADVSYQIKGKTHQSTLSVSQSYQYDKSKLTSHDKQYEQVKASLFADLARQIGEQYRILSD